MVWPLKDALTGHTLACRRLGGGMEGTESRLANRFEVSGGKEEALTLPPPGQETLQGERGRSH